MNHNILHCCVCVAFELLEVTFGIVSLLSVVLRMEMPRSKMCTVHNYYTYKLKFNNVHMMVKLTECDVAQQREARIRQLLETISVS